MDSSSRLAIVPDMIPSRVCHGVSDKNNKQNQKEHSCQIILLKKQANCLALTHLTHLLITDGRTYCQPTIHTYYLY